MDNRIDDSTCADSINYHCEGKPDHRLQHNLTNVPDDGDCYGEDCQESEVL